MNTANKLIANLELVVGTSILASVILNIAVPGVTWKLSALAGFAAVCVVRGCIGVSKYWGDK
ncbi:MAG: hypothetical protein JWR85_4208 [Marmoricola sp.]|nr:hypothetical protein [Marmoricola sp.]